MSENDLPAGNGSADPAAGGAAAGAAPGQGPAPVIKMLAHFVRDLSFENVGVREGTSAEGQPEINVAFNLEGNKFDENRFQSVMKINATAKNAHGTRFIVELEYCGIFELQNVPENLITLVLFTECPRQILPFARRVVADATRDGGYPPLLLDNVDFMALYRQRVEQIKKEQAAAAGGAGMPQS
ncbi:MAG: protein-export chaperone SecB [Pseudomonadota bacterium]